MLFASNKKGTALDLLPIIVTLFGFGVTIVIMFVVWTNITGTGALSTTSQSAQIVTTTNSQWSIWDNLFFAAIIGLSLTSIVAAAILRTTPLFFFISLILVAIILVIAAMVSNSFESATGELPAYVQAEFPKMFFIMDNLALYCLGMGVLITIALFGVRNRGL